MSKPNILFIMTDQQRADALGCSGGWVDTPNFDRLAREGVRFANCVTTSPVCVPARRSMATGRYPHNTGVWANGPTTISDQSRTWMQLVRDAGYRTSLFGKTHLHPHGGDLRDRLPLMHAIGLDDVDEIGGPRASARVKSNMTDLWEREGYWSAYQDDYAERFSNVPWVVRPSVLPLALYADVYVGRQAATYLRDYQHDQPWCCWVSFGGPHEPWDTPEPYASQFNPADMPPPAPRPAWTADLPEESELARRCGAFSDITPDVAAKLRADYAGNVALIDHQVGEILKAIEARGELDNTVVVFTSDHGEHNGDFGLVYKQTFLDGAVRVPMIVRTPETASSDVAGTVSETLVEWIDAGATIAECAGAQYDYAQNAKSLCPTLADPSVEHREHALSEVAGEVMLLDREWKIALTREGQTYLLFNVQDDPQEQHNLAGSPTVAAIEQRMRDTILERVIASQTPHD